MKTGQAAKMKVKRECAMNRAEIKIDLSHIPRDNKQAEELAAILRRIADNLEVTGILAIKQSVLDANGRFIGTFLVI